MGLFSVSVIFCCNRYKGWLLSFFFFPWWDKRSNISFETLGLVHWLSSLLSMTFIISYLIRGRNLWFVFWKIKIAIFRCCFVFIYLYYSLCPDISVHDMKRCFLALTILRGKAKALVKCQHWYGLKKNTAALAVRVYVVSWWSSFMRSAMAFILQISNWDKLDKCNSFLEIVEGALRVQIHPS